MKEKRLLPLLAVLLAIPFTAAAQRPNVILILMDDMGWGDLPSYQDQRMKEGLPAMDNPGLRTDAPLFLRPALRPGPQLPVHGGAPGPCQGDPGQVL